MTVKEQSRTIINPTVDNAPLKIIKMLSGEIPIPRTMMAGKDCARKHGVKGKTIRYVANRTCIACDVHTKDKAKTEKNAKDPHNEMHRVAAEVRERKRMKSIHKEVWDE